jgi:putative flippase GtrA
VNVPPRFQAFYDRHGEKVRFLFVGGWNTLFSIGVLWVLDRYIPYDAKSLVQKEAVLVLSWVISVTQNFFTFKLLVFRTRGNWLKEYLRMYVTYAAAFVVQSGIILALSTWLGWSLFWANLPTIVVVTVMSYFGHKYFTFRGRHVIEGVDAGDVFEPQPSERDDSKR